MKKIKLRISFLNIYKKKIKMIYLLIAVGIFFVAVGLAFITESKKTNSLN